MVYARLDNSNFNHHANGGLPFSDAPLVAVGTGLIPARTIGAETGGRDPGELLRSEKTTNRRNDQRSQEQHRHTKAEKTTLANIEIPR